VPDQAANGGYWQSLADTSKCSLTCARAGPGLPAHVLLSSRSRVRVAVGAQVMGGPSECGSRSSHLPSVGRRRGPAVFTLAHFVDALEVVIAEAVEPVANFWFELEVIQMPYSAAHAWSDYRAVGRMLSYSYRAMPGHIRLLRLQLNGTSGDIQHLQLSQGRPCGPGRWPGPGRRPVAC
jgi:hypothetical protein